MDSGPNNLAITNTGTPTQGSFSPFGSNWSNYFDGTGDYLSIPTNAAFEFGSGDFTTECWIYPIAFNAIDGGFMTVGAQDGGASWVLRGAANESLSFTTWSSGGTVGISFSSAAGSLKFNNWSHIAVTRSGNTWGIWVNGTSVATTTGSSAIGNTGRPAYIAYGYSSTAGRQQNCYISNVRWVKGTAVYTGAFTPSTTPLTAIAGTSLLTCQSNRIKDSSTNNFAITKVGDTTVSSYSPFSTTTGYVPSIYSGSMYFNGTTDYIALPNSSSEINLSSGDFTVECWFNTTNAVTAQTLVWLGGNTSAYSAIRFGIDTNGLIFYGSNDGASWVINTGALGSGIVSNTWNHAAVARFGNVIKVFLNGNQVGTDIAKSGSFWTSGTLNYIGSLNYTAVGGTPFRQMNGYISNVRIVKGTALYTANFTPSTTPLTAVTNTGLLLSGTNAGIIDSSMQSNYTTVGDSKVSSGAVKYGTGAMYFDGTGDYLNGPFSPLYAIESCDFTVEAWVYRNAIGAEHNIAITRDVAGGDGWNLRINATNTLQFYYNAGTSISSTGTIPLNTWTHIAATRNGTAGKLFINGVIDGTATFVNGTTTTQRLRIGVSATNAAGYFNGYIDDLRITKGFARYTANFTPSAVAFLKN